MNLLTRISSALTGGTRRKGTGGTLYAPHGTGGWTSVFNLAGQRATGTTRLSAGDQLAQNIGVVHAAVNRIADDISSLDVRVEVQRRGRGWVRDDQHPLALLLAQPCAAFDGPSLRHVLQQHLSLTGRAALLVVDGLGGQPRELHVLYPHLLDPIPHPVEYVSAYRYTSLSGTQTYHPPFRDRPDASGVTVLDSRVPDPSNPYAGNSIVQAAGHSITLDSEVRAYARFYFANNAVPGAVLESDQGYPGPDAAAALRDSWNATYQGMYNSGKIAPLWGGLKLKTIAPAFKDLQFPEITKSTRQDILMHFGVPGPVLGYTDTGALGADTFKAALSVYQKQTLDPHRRRLQALLNRLAARWPGTRVQIESPVEEDIAALEKRQLEEFRTGAISRAEYRGARGYEIDDQPNVWLLPTGVQVVHSLDPTETSTPPPSTPPTDGEPRAQRAQRYRLLWADEYRTLRDAPPDPDARRAAGEACRARWQAEGPQVADLADRMRLAALNAAHGDLVTAYEALKAEARALADA